jgi:hypothetical protein
MALLLATSPMSASDLAAIVVTGCSIVAVVAVLFALQRTLATLRRVGRTLDELEERALPLVDELEATVEGANGELERMERLVGSAESISATVDATSKLAYRALSAPVIKTAALTSGASKAARRLRDRTPEPVSAPVSEPVAEPRRLGRRRAAATAAAPAPRRRARRSGPAEDPSTNHPAAIEEEG